MREWAEGGTQEFGRVVEAEGTSSVCQGLNKPTRWQTGLGRRWQAHATEESLLKADACSP